MWLKDTDYVAGDEISIADLLLSTEIDMLILLDTTPQVNISEQAGRTLRV